MTMKLVGKMLYTMNVTCLKCGQVYALRHETKKKLEESTVALVTCSGCNRRGTLRTGEVEFRRADLVKDVESYRTEIAEMKGKIREIHLLLEMNQDERMKKL